VIAIVELDEENRHVPCSKNGRSAGRLAGRRA
jgi:hypothetical protein